MGRAIFHAAPALELIQLAVQKVESWKVGNSQAASGV
jgi:hypothetical protein